MKKSQDSEEPDFKFQDQMYENQKRLIENNFDKRAKEHYNCFCDICEYQVNKIKTMPNIDVIASKRNSQVISQSDRDFNLVMRKLLPPNKFIRSVRLCIPETVCFSQGEPRFIVYTGKENLALKFQRQNLTFPLIRKFMNERRFKPKSDIPYEAVSRIYEAVLVKYDDNNVQILGDNEFLILMMRRRIDPLWQHIQYIQNFVIPKKPSYSLNIVQFQFSKVSITSLFKRAKLEISQLSGDISKASQDYIPLDQEEDFEKKLLQEDVMKYLQYTVYKIVHYLEVFGSIKLDEAKFYFMLDRFDQYNLISIDHVNYSELTKRPYFDAEVLLQKKKNQEESDEEEMIKCLLEQERQYAAKIFQELMEMEENMNQADNVHNLVNRNKLAVIGEDISQKKKIELFQRNFNQVKESIEPIETLKSVVFGHQSAMEKRFQKLKQNRLDNTKSFLAKSLVTIPGYRKPEKRPQLHSPKGIFALQPPPPIKRSHRYYKKSL